MVHCTYIYCSQQSLLPVWWYHWDSNTSWGHSYGTGIVTSPGAFPWGVSHVRSTSSVWPGPLARILSEMPELLSPPSALGLGLLAEASRSRTGCSSPAFLPVSGLHAGATACQLAASQARLGLLYKAPFHLGASGKHNGAAITGAGASLGLGDTWQGASYG